MVGRYKEITASTRAATHGVVLGWGVGNNSGASAVGWAVAGVFGSAADGETDAGDGIAEALGEANPAGVGVTGSEAQAATKNKAMAKSAAVVIGRETRRHKSRPDQVRRPPEAPR